MVRRGTTGVLLVFGAAVWLVLVLRIFYVQADDMALVSEKGAADTVQRKSLMTAGDDTVKRESQSESVMMSVENERTESRQNKRSVKASEESGAECVNVNSADVKQLEQLHGIGPVLAKRICAYRTQHGVFSTPDDLKEVKGIGPATVKKIRTEICF